MVAQPQRLPPAGPLSSTPPWQTELLSLRLILHCGSTLLFFSLPPLLFPFTLHPPFKFQPHLQILHPPHPAPCIFSKLPCSCPDVNRTEQLIASEPTHHHDAERTSELRPSLDANAAAFNCHTYQRRPSRHWFEKRNARAFLFLWSTRPRGLKSKKSKPNSANYANRWSART